MFLRCLTSSATNLVKKSPRVPLIKNLWEVKRCNFCLTSVSREKKTRWFLKKDNADSKILRPGNRCLDVSPKPILDPRCKSAVIIGGADGFGFAAADHLLGQGAREVIITNDDYTQGMSAAQRLCDSHGKDRANFIQCNIRNMIQFEAALQNALCKLKKIHILFNDLDKNWLPLESKQNCEPKWNNTTRGINAGLKIIGKKNAGPDGIIINCASILGFMDWPEDPCPVYCKKEPVIETTIDFAREYCEKKTGVRLVALCPANKQFSEIRLPCFPDMKCSSERPPCIPFAKWRIGKALSHVLAFAKSGTAWIVEAAPCAYDVPRRIHFPKKKGEKIDPAVYSTYPCPPSLGQKGAEKSKTRPKKIRKNCQKK